MDNDFVTLLKIRLLKYLYFADDIHTNASIRRLEEVYRTLSIEKLVYYVS